MSKFSGLGITVEQPSRMEIIHPHTGEIMRITETGEVAWIDVLSSSSAAGRAHDRDVLDSQNNRGSRPRPMTAKKIEEILTKKAATLTRGWRLADLYGNAIDVEYSEAFAYELYEKEEAAWLREQVLNFADNLGNFPHGASKN